MFVIGAPAPALAGLIDSYLAYRTVGGTARLHRGLPTGTLTFIVSIDEPIVTVDGPHDAPAAGRTSYHAAVAGFHTGPSYIACPANYAGLAINLRPAGARRLLGLPASALAGHTVELADITGPIGRELWERLQEAPPDDAATWFAAGDQVLQRLLGRHESAATAASTASEVRRAWQLLDASGGSTHITAVAEEVGWSRQHLNRRFQAEFGVSPKQLARIVRIERSRDALRGRPARSPLGRELASHGPVTSFADLAAVCGYADQAHLTREWSDLAGCTPATWCREEGVVPFLQDRRRQHQPV